MKVIFNFEKNKFRKNHFLTASDRLAEGQFFAKKYPEKGFEFISGKTPECC